MGDFTGFTFGGVHTSSLGITRISGGDRYNEELFPEIKDRTAEIPGLNGEYYFGSDYGPRKIDIEIAFNSVTEEQFRKLRQTFKNKVVQDLIFDERPYKRYIAKIESPVELSYVCFDEQKKHIDTSGTARGVRRVEEIHTEDIIDEETGEPTGETVEVTERVRETIYPYVMDEGTQRIYKGEGKITFVCYFPFAKSVYKVLPQGSEEWAISSGILTVTEYASVDTYTTLNPPAEGEEQQEPVIKGMKVYNAGDIDTGFRLYVPSSALGAMTLTYTDSIMSNEATASLVINQITLKTGDIGVLIDTTNQLIVGVSSFTRAQSGNVSYTTSGNLYNEYVSSGYFFRFEPNDRFDRGILEIEGGGEGIEIFYDYLYF